MKMKFNNLSGTVKVLIGCLFITIIIFIGSLVYYGNINSAEDPRTLPAKTLLLQYEKKLDEEQTSKAHEVLNGMLNIYLALPAYENSYEVGVVYNNIASVYLVHSIPVPAVCFSSCVCPSCSFHSCSWSFYSSFCSI